MKGGVVNVLGDRIVVRADGDLLLLDVIGDHDTGVGDILSGSFDSTDPLLNETKGEDIAVFLESDDAGWLLELADDELLRRVDTSDQGEHDII